MAQGPNKLRSSASGKKSGERRTVTVSPGTVTNATTKEVTATVTGLSTSDVVNVNPTAALTANIGIVGVRVSSANTLSVLFINPTAAPIAAADVALRVHVTKFSN